MTRKCLAYLLLTTLSAWLLGRPGVAQDEQVDQFGRLSALVLKGLVLLDEGEVREALGNDFEALLAAHPRAPLEDLPATVRQRLLSGLHQAGFAEAKVEVQINRDRLCLEAQIHEGPRYTCGEIQIEGAEELDVPALLERLTQPFPPVEAVRAEFDSRGIDKVAKWYDRDGKAVSLTDPVWQTGKPAPLSEEARRSLHRKVTAAMTDHGYRAPLFDIQLQTDSHNHSAALVVRLLKEGLPAIIREIEVSGNDRNSREVILDYLDLEAGVLLTRQRQTRIEYDLWRSGRFIKYEVNPDSEKWSNATGRLKLELMESPYSPPLDRELSREQQALLRMRDWLADPSRWQGDLVGTYTLEEMRARLILSPNQGTFVSLSATSDGSHGAFVIAGAVEQVGCYLMDRREKLETDVLDAVLKPTLSWSLSDDADKTYVMNFGLGVTSGRRENGLPPIVLHVDCSPVAAVGLAELRDARTEWDGDILTVTNEDRRISIDATSGRLIALSGRKDTEETDLRFEAGAFQTRYEHLKETTAQYRNRYEKDHPVTSLATFLTDEEVIESALGWIGIDEQKLADFRNTLPRLRLIRRLVELGVLHPIDRWIVEDEPEPEHKFSIPSSKPPAGMMEVFARLSLPLADDWFPRDTWPWTVWRETAMTLADRGVYTGPEAQRLFYSQEAGPVSHLIVGLLLQSAKPSWSQMFLERAVILAEGENFARDYEPLLDDSYLAGRCLTRAAELVRAMEPAEVEELVRTWEEPWRGGFTELAAELRRRRNEPIQAALKHALDHSWEAGMREATIDYLRSLSVP